VWRVESRPDWCTSADLREVRDASGLTGRWAALLDPRGGSAVWEQIERSPRVERVVAMRRRLPDRFDALVEIRRPVAAVRMPGAADCWVEVDAEGRCLSLPSPERPVRQGRPLRVVTGAYLPSLRAGEALRPGRKFGRDVQEAASLAAELDAFSLGGDGEELRILDEIDVSNFEGRRDLGASEVLLRATGWTPPVADPAAASPPFAAPHPVAARPPSAAARPPAPTLCVVEWGRAGATHPWDGEPTFGAKAAHLLRSLRMFPRLQGLSRVRVAFADLVVVPSSAPRRQ